MINWLKTGKWTKQKEYLFDAIIEKPIYVDGTFKIDFKVLDKLWIKT
jgi:hypothetical protein